MGTEANFRRINAAEESADLNLRRELGLVSIQVNGSNVALKVDSLFTWPS
jgi:hypothetical protein